MAEKETVVAERLVGVDGAVVSAVAPIVTVVCAVLVPLLFEAVRVYVVVTEGETDTEALEVADSVPTPSLILTKSAPVVVRESVL